MTTLTISQLKALREHTKQCITRDIMKALDNMFDFIESTQICNQPSEVPPDMCPFGGLEGIFASSNSQFNQLTDNCSLLKKSFDSAFEPFLTDSDDATSGNSSNAGFSIFGSEELKKIFENVSLNQPVTFGAGSSGQASFTGLTNGGFSDCESDRNQNFYSASSSFSPDDLMTKINQEVFSHNNKAPSVTSSAENNPSPPESPLVQPPMVKSPPGPITPPKKLIRYPAEMHSFAEVAAASATKLPTKTAKANDRPLMALTGKPDVTKLALNKKCSSSDGGDGGSVLPLPPQQDENNCQFRTLQVRCYVDNCQDVFSHTTMLNEHLKRGHGVLRYRCPLIISCGQSFDDRSKHLLHMEACHSNQVEWLCEKCPESTIAFSNSYDLYGHHYLFHQEGVFECPNDGCFALATNRKEVIDHFNTNHNQRYASTNQQYLIIYLNCIIPRCSTRLHNKKDLDSHLTKVHNMHPVLCFVDGCLQSFSNIEQVTHHVQQVHGNPMVIFCSVPDCNFKTTNGHRRLSSHFYWQHYEGHFKCAKCAKTGKCRGDMTDHYTKVHK